ncbi:lysophospholipid acyltransferase family protein [Alkanindiges sp. WGS2144]|uniref:lysophospholipid acyltransferase family protein n=1 Tax=Alkanindiges sp. WGS2144 TaxID=3366808 RepID=UPI0037538893
MYLFLKILSALPLFTLRFLARCIANLIILMPHTGMRWIVHINLSLAYPKLSAQQRESLEKASIYSQCFTAVESIKSWGMPTDYSLAQIRTVSGSELLLTALQQAHGLILVVPHFGTWELMNAWINQYASPVIMYKPSKNASVDRFMLEARQRLNATLVPTNDSGVRAIFKALKKGGVTAILPDHVPDHSGGIYAPFFGQQVLTTTLVSRLAQKTQCSVLGLSCIRRSDLSGFDLICEKLNSQILSQDLQQSVNALNADIERMIARAPEQYMWGYKRFKQTQAQSEIYKKP